VLSSLHGTDASAALHRLLDMGIEAFLIASSVMGIIGQRLLRRICDSCKTSYAPDAEELALFHRHLPDNSKELFFHGTGCDDCSQTGYRDRIGVYELLRISPRIRQLLVDHATTEQVRDAAIEEGMRPMIVEAMNLVDDDVTTVAEVIRTLYVA
jgi:type IV pilus assembly protein PilB